MMLTDKPVPITADKPARIAVATSRVPVLTSALNPDQTRTLTPPLSSGRCQTGSPVSMSNAFSPSRSVAT